MLKVYTSMGSYAKRLVKQNLVHGWVIPVGAIHFWGGDRLPVIIDNGAWSAYASGKDWNAPRAVDLMVELYEERIGQRPIDGMVLPDKIGDMEATMTWAREFVDLDFPWMLAIQEGYDREEVRAFVAKHDCQIFVGGKTLGFKRRVVDDLQLQCHVARISHKQDLVWAREHSLVQSVDSSNFNRSYNPGSHKLRALQDQTCLDPFIPQADSVEIVSV